MLKVRAAIAVGALLAALGGHAFAPVPAESEKALGGTRGGVITSGAVFINGKFVEAPYVVERRGTGIRVNGMPVTGQVVSWNAFLKTQSGVKKATERTPPPPPAAKPPEPAVEDVDASSLDDLFDDDPKPVRKKPSAKPAWQPKPAASRPKVSYELEGDFVANDTTRMLVKRINALRTEFDRTLRSGGFIFFGDGYSRVSGDARTLQTMLKALPELLQKSSDLESFRRGVRDADLVYLNEILCEELYGHREDYRKLRSLRMKLRREQQWKQVLEDAATPLF